MERHQLCWQRGEELRDAYYQAYKDIYGFIDGRHANCDVGAQKLPPLSEAEQASASGM